MSITEDQARYTGDGLQAEICPAVDGTFIVGLYAYVWDDDANNAWPCVASRPFNRHPDAETCALNWCNLP